MSTNSLKVCPFCGSNDIKISFKVASRKRTSAVYHVSAYCNKCKSMGPRVLAHVESSSINSIESNEKFINMALSMWNTRYVK